MDDVVPGEHDIFGIERIAIRPFCAFDQLHDQDFAVFLPFPAFRKVRQRLDVIFAQEGRAGNQ